jgi:hypothetical protein
MLDTEHPGAADERVGEGLERFGRRALCRAPEQLRGTLGVPQARVFTGAARELDGDEVEERERQHHRDEERDQDLQAEAEDASVHRGMLSRKGRPRGENGARRA